MDLKGSLIDTNLKIYPTEKCIAYIKTLKSSNTLPHNIEQIVKGSNAFKTYVNDKEFPICLTNKDIEIIKKINDKYPVIETTTESIVDSNTDAMSNTDDKNQTKKKEEKKEMPKDIKKNKMETKDDSEQNSERSDTKKKDDKIFLVTADLEWLYKNLNDRRLNGENNIPYLHTLLEGAEIVVPENVQIERNPVLEARCVKLRAQQEAREYRKMTKGVDNVRMKFPEDSISYQLKQLNRQLIAIGQFIISIFAGFLFGFRGVEWMVGNLDFGFRLLLGVMCALVIALAEIYFLAKKLNEELSIPETVQLGGPLKFADPKYNPPNDNKPVLDKEHQD